MRPCRGGQAKRPSRLFILLNFAHALTRLRDHLRTVNIFTCNFNKEVAIKARMALYLYALLRRPATIALGEYAARPCIAAPHAAIATS
jgi:hypothetical protein